MPLHAAKLFYVSPNGNDSWKGENANVRSGSQDGPVATLNRALELARAWRANHPDQLHIQLRGGIYAVQDTVLLGPDDSGGSEQQPLIIEAYAAEKPVLSGGIVLSNAVQLSSASNLWSFPLPASMQNQEPHQLFLAGHRQTRARTPNKGFYLMKGEVTQLSPMQFLYNNSDLPKDLKAGSGAEVMTFHKWIAVREPIASINPEKQMITLAGKIPDQITEGNARYYFENYLEALDAPGEWFLDKANQRLLFISPANWKPGSDQMIASILKKELVFLKGESAQRPVRNIEFRGITFAYSDWSMGPEGFVDNQAANSIRGSVRAQSAENCRFVGCKFEHLANYAIDFGSGCTQCAVEGCEIYDIGGGGIRIGETHGGDECAHNTVMNCYLHELGRVYPAAVGVLILQSAYNTITQNKMDDLYYTGVSVGWTWGYKDSPCHHNAITFNEISHIGQDMLSDMGGVYTLGPQPGTVVANNLIHDVSSYTYGGWGLYPDEGSTGILFENNIVYRTKSAGFHQHYGKENRVQNNIFAFGKEHQLMRTREESHLSFFFERNVVYFDSGELLGSNWSNDQFKMDYNLYFDARLKSNQEQMHFGNRTWKQWRQSGHDQHSVLADPKFKSVQNLDFDLAPDSPALALGFQPIDVKKIGPQK